MELPQTQEFSYNGPRRWKEPTTVFDRITFDPKIMGGRACIRGMRIPVSVVVGQIAHGAAMEEVLREYPDLEPDDVTQALAYTAWLAHEEVHPA
jgi:uncharacterized protein (DUF433 family)